MTDVVNCGPAAPEIKRDRDDVVMTLRLRPSDGDVIMRLSVADARALAAALIAMTTDTAPRRAARICA